MASLWMTLTPGQGVMLLHCDAPPSLRQALFAVFK